MHPFIHTFLATSMFLLGAALLVAGAAIYLDGHQISTEALGDIATCGASVSPTSAQVNSTVPLVFTVNNTDSADIRWVKFIAASENFEIISGSSAGWSTVLESPTEIIFRNGTLSPGGSRNFTVNVQTGVHPNSAATWPVKASDTTTGTNPATCSGDTAIAIIGDDTTAPAISNISVSNITTSAARITWTTDEAADTVLEWGTTTSYGSTETDSSLVNSHTVNLSGLSAATGYHYRIKATDSSGNLGQSSDNTFTTAQASGGEEEEEPEASTPTPTPTPTASTSTTSSNSSTSAAASPTPTPTSTTVVRTRVVQRPTAAPTPTPTPSPVPSVAVVADTQPPSVRITTDLSAPVPRSPEIAGEATDDRAVARVDYSTDGGRNWLPATLDAEPNRQGVAFAFTPAVTADDNYEIVVRAFDFAGNVGLSGSVILIIDQLPPRAGVPLLSVGPQLLEPSSDGIVYGAMAIDTKVTLASTGGATTIDVIAPVPAAAGNAPLPHVFSLVKNVESGLWSGIMHFTKPGTYQLTVQATDGAGNVTQRSLATMVVVPGGQVSDRLAPLSQATVELFYWEPTLQQFVSWQGGAFQQINPQQTDQNGRYHFLIPPGRYFATVTAPGYKTTTTTIMTIDHSQPLLADITMLPREYWQIGSWRLPRPQWRSEIVTPVVLTAEPAAGAPHALVGTLAPFAVDAAGGSVVTEPREQLLTFMTAWSPQTGEQLAILNRLFVDQQRSLGVVIGDTTAESAVALRRRGGYAVPMVADVTGELFERYAITATPTHVVIDATGTITQVLSGVLNEADLGHTFNK